MGRRAALVTAAGLVLGPPAYTVLVDQGQAPADAAAHVAVAWTYLAAGLVAWWRRPRSRVGFLLVAAGFALLVRRFQYSDDSALFTAAFGLGELSIALIAHAVLSYPSGRLESRIDRLIVNAGYAAVLAFPLATLAVYDTGDSCLFWCGASDPPESVLLVYGNDDLFAATRDGFDVVVYGLLGTAFLARITYKLLTASPARRRMLAPLLVAGLAAGVRVVTEGALTFTEYSEGTRQTLFWWQISVQSALPVALLVGLLRARLARLTLTGLVLELERTPASRVPDALRRALHDPSLEVAYWLPETEVYVDDDGRPVTLPERRPDRAVTRLHHDEEPIAALVHDPALEEVPVVLEAAGAAARLALENARLEAELRAQLAAVRESRARIVSAGDAERRRIEQDLHDGAQQRLVALALELRAAQRRLGLEGDAEVAGVLERTVAELQRAVEELRELAHGLRPPVLTQSGLAAALNDLADRSPIRVTVEAAPAQRLSPEVEAAAYFVACEALANVVKHSGASAATVSAVRDDGRLVVVIADDGVGGADIRLGTGLRGLCDRLEAHGGTLRVESPRGGGTRVVGRIPCVS